MVVLTKFHLLYTEIKHFGYITLVKQLLKKTDPLLLKVKQFRHVCFLINECGRLWQRFFSTSIRRKHNL